MKLKISKTKDQQNERKEKRNSMSEILLVNLTPHAVLYDGGCVDGDGRRDQEALLPPDGRVARVGIESRQEKPLQYGAIGIPIRSTVPGKVEGLPPPANGTIYVVSGMVLAAIPDDRRDVVAPGELVRDDQGRPVGCLGFTSKPGGVIVPQDLCKSCGEERNTSGHAGYCGRCLGED